MRNLTVIIGKFNINVHRNKCTKHGYPQTTFYTSEVLRKFHYIIQDRSVQKNRNKTNAPVFWKYEFCRGPIIADLNQFIGKSKKQKRGMGGEKFPVLPFPPHYSLMTFNLTSNDMNDITK